MKWQQSLKVKVTLTPGFRWQAILPRHTVVLVLIPPCKTVQYSCTYVHTTASASHENKHTRLQSSEDKQIIITLTDLNTIAPRIPKSCFVALYDTQRVVRHILFPLTRRRIMRVVFGQGFHCTERMITLNVKT